MISYSSKQPQIYNGEYSLAYPAHGRWRGFAQSNLNFTLKNGLLLFSRLDYYSTKTCIAFCNVQHDPNRQKKVPDRLEDFTLINLGDYSIVEVSDWYCLETSEVVSKAYPTSIIFPYSISESENVTRSESATMISSVEDTYIPTLAWLWIEAWSAVDKQYVDKTIFTAERTRLIDELPFDLYTVMTDMELSRYGRGMSSVTTYYVHRLVLHLCYCKRAFYNGEDSPREFSFKYVFEFLSSRFRLVL